MLPVLIMLDKGKLKFALFLFIFLMAPILLKIYMSDFDFLVLVQLIFWTFSFIGIKFLSLFRK
jgi:hypothetical protein